MNLIGSMVQGKVSLSLVLAVKSQNVIVSPATDNKLVSIITSRKTKGVNE
jgi:hypothetical protein